MGIFRQLTVLVFDFHLLVPIFMARKKVSNPGLFDPFHSSFG